MDLGELLLKLVFPQFGKVRGVLIGVGNNGPVVGVMGARN